ncbi:uncharacterized protein LOC124498404 [Dermatophagoides farinae]|nr:uncharacterized protein LOC124498404 [Dermatophagoides farinae]
MFTMIMAQTNDRIVKPPYGFRLKKWLTIILNLINLIILLYLVINLIMTSNYFGSKYQHRMALTNSTKSIRQYNYFAIFPYYIDYYDQYQKQQPDDEDFNQSITELYTNITEIIIDLIGLVAVIKEHYWLSLIYIVLGMINLIGTIVMYTEMRTYVTLAQMILAIIFYSVLLFYVNDLMNIRKQQKIQDEEEEEEQQQNI